MRSVFKGLRNDDDLSKPYGSWFQNDVLGDDFRRPQGKRLGLEPAQGWVIRALQHLEDADSTNEAAELEGAGKEASPAAMEVRPCGERRGVVSEVSSINGSFNLPILPDLNVPIINDDVMTDNLAVVSSQSNPIFEGGGDLSFFWIKFGGVNGGKFKFNWGGGLPLILMWSLLERHEIRGRIWAHDRI